jgi:hypothetical protein
VVTEIVAQSIAVSAGTCLIKTPLIMLIQLDNNFEFNRYQRHTDEAIVFFLCLPCFFHMAASGAVLTLGYDGDLRVERGLIRPGDTAPSDTAIEDEGIAGTTGDNGARGKRHGESNRLTEAVSRRHGR